MVTARLPSDSLYRELNAEPEAPLRAGIGTLARIGDCFAPGMIAHAVYSGYRFAQEFDESPTNELSFKTEPVWLAG
jgi:dimethylamine/trimethylamine dehydrogenase